VGDRILTLQWEKQDPVDVSDATPEEISRIVASDNQSKLSITLQKSDGSTRKVILQKAKAVVDDDLGRVKSFLLKGSKTIGFISLPAFYSDWESGRPDGYGCSDDVAKEIVKLKKEGLDALILDIRYNGGGSVGEAVSLAGIFIDSGPVALMQDKDKRILTLKDMNRGTIYDGPLLVMVNGLSASASEMLAGALQDYHRALIVGSPTYGKATAQIVLPLDSTASPDHIWESSKRGPYLKITINRIFRVNGTTAQEQGVRPDIVVRDLSEADPEREKNADFVIKASKIEPNRYYKSYPPLPVTDLRNYAAAFTDTNRYYKALREYLAELDSLKEPRDYSLTFHKPEQVIKNGEVKNPSDSTGSIRAKAPFEVLWNQYEKERMKTDESLRFDDELWKKLLTSDQEILLCYLIASRMAGH
jgi:carboxyl-terminal processing protease